MKKNMLMLLTLLVFTVTFGGSVFAETVFYEPFNYGPGLLQDVSDWTKVDGDGNENFELQDTTLRYGDMPVSGGHIQSFITTGGSRGYTLNRVAADIADAGLLADGQTLWISAIVQTLTHANASLVVRLGEDYVNAFYSITGGSGDSVGFNFQNGSDFQGRYHTKGTQVNNGFIQTNVPTDAPIMVVVEMIWSADSASPDKLNYYMPGEDLVLGSPKKTINDIVFNQAAFDTFSVSQSNPGVLIDEIRIGATYEDVLGDPLSPNIVSNPDMVTWFDTPVTPDPNVVNRDPGDPQVNLTYEWSAEPVPGLDIAIVNPTAAIPEITVNKAELLEVGVADDSWNDVNDLSAIGDPGASGILLDSSIPDDPNAIYATVSEPIPAGDYIVTLDYYVPATGGITTGSSIGAGLYDVNELGPWDGSEVGVSAQDSELDTTADTWMTLEIPLTTTVDSDTVRIDVGGTAAGMVFVKNVIVSQPPIITADMTAVTVQVDVRYEGNPDPNGVTIDWMTIEVYANACLAARDGLGKDSDTDFNKNCVTAIEDLLTIAAAWLGDSSATQAYVGVVPSTVVTTITGTAQGPAKQNWATDNWSNADNWDAGIPSGKIGVVIPDNMVASIGTPTPVYDGSVTIGVGATLMPYGTDFDILNAFGSGIIMEQDSSVIMRFGNRNTTTFTQPFLLVGDATIRGGESTNGQHTTRIFDGPIMGPGELTLHGVNNNTMKLNVSNSFKGGLTTYAVDSWRIEANAAGSLGPRDVTINGRSNGDLTRGVSLYVNAADVMNPNATLYLNGGRDHRKPAKLVLNNDLIVASCVLDGTSMDPNVVGYSSSDGLLTSNGDQLISGSGRLIVTGPNPNLPAGVTVDAGTNIITASGFEITVDPNVVNSSGLTAAYAWTATDVPAGITVDITQETDLAPTVTITKDAETGTVEVVTLTLTVTVDGKEISDTVSIDVYDNGCALVLDLDVSRVAAVASDLNIDCFTNVGDFAILAEDWLVDYSLEQSEPKP